jgi:hypothetical protein
MEQNFGKSGKFPGSPEDESKGILAHLKENWPMWLVIGPMIGFYAYVCVSVLTEKAMNHGIPFPLAVIVGIVATVVIHVIAPLLSYVFA